MFNVLMIFQDPWSSVAFFFPGILANRCMIATSIMVTKSVIPDLENIQIQIDWTLHC